LKKYLTLPSPFLERIKTQLGAGSEAFFNAFDEETPISIRINPLKKPKEIAGTALENLNQVAWNKNGYYLLERPIFTIDPLFQAGAYYVQEASSMFLSKILNQIVSHLPIEAKILDLCAAPGGKSTLILDEIPTTMLLVANEVIRARAAILADNITKWGKSNAIVTSNDPRDFKKLSQYFDVIVADAPCSGEGMFRKGQNAIQEWSEENVAICSARQQRIIDDILPSLKSNGYLIYCTCTFSPAENRENLEKFIVEHQLKSVEIHLDFNSNIEAVNDNDIYSYHFYHHKTKGEGFFIACLQKIENEEIDADLRGFKFEFLSKKQIPLLKKWIFATDTLEFIIWKDVIEAFPKPLANDISLLSKHLFVIKKGIEIGKIMGNDIIPSHELALSELANAEMTCCELSKTEALIYLKKGDVSNFEAVLALPNGWALIQYEGKNLGWIKKMGHRTNNYLPKELRILKDF